MSSREFGISAGRARWLWPVQIVVGGLCIVLAIAIMFSPQLGSYAFLILAGTGLIILGAERIVAGIRSSRVKRSSRAINIGLGATIIVWIGSGFIFPEIAAQYFVLFLGFGLLANGSVRIFEGLKKRKSDSSSIVLLGAGVMSVAVAVLVLVFPTVGLALLLLITAFALVVCGIQVLLVGIRGGRRDNIDEHTRKSDYAEMNRQAAGSNGIWKRGSWFSDAEGRYLLFRGVNFGSRSKLPPYLPIAPLATTSIPQLDVKKEVALMAKELDLLKDLGFNVVRLLISWKAVEPYPNPNLAELLPEARSYLLAVTKVIDALYARNMYVILDFHQDIAHEVYGGDGFPDWAVAIDEHNPKPEPSDLKDKKWQIKYSINKSVKHTLRSFWHNSLTNTEWMLDDYPVRTHMEKSIGQVVTFFKSFEDGQGHPAILGIEPANEPHPVGMPKEEFESQMLMRYYRNVNSELAQAAPHLFIFMEPRVDWTVSFGGGEEGGLGPTPFSARSAFHTGLIKDVMVEQRIDSKRIHTHLPKNLGSLDRFGQNGVLSFHYYDAIAVASSFLKIPEAMHTYKREWPFIFDQLVKAAFDRGVIPFLTEFGGYQGTEQIREYMNLQFEQIEAHLLNATYWNFDLYYTAEAKDNWNLEDYSLLGEFKTPRNIDVVSRPYPMRSSAEPILLFFDIVSKVMTIILRGHVVDAPTIIYVPFNFHYKKGFTVWATGEKVEWDRKSQLLSWAPSKEIAINQIVITRGTELDTNALPVKARNVPGTLKAMGTFS